MTIRAPRSWSLESRLSRHLILLVGLGWLVTIAITAVLVDREMNEMMDQELRALADDTILLLDATEGAVLPRSIGVSGDGDERMLRIVPAGFDPPPAPWELVTRDGLSESNGWRVLRITAENAVIEIGHNIAWRREEVMEASVALVLFLLPLLALVLVAVRRSVRGAVEPARALAVEVKRRGSDDFTPVRGEALPDELRPVVTSLNQYIRRVAELREAERAFIANAAHELRTPLAAIRARLDAQTVVTSDELKPVLERLSRRIERLLQLSRSESGVAFGQGPCDLVQILRLILDEPARRPGVPVLLDDGDLEALPLPVDPDALAILLRNIIDNAVENSTAGVRIVLHPPGRLVVENPVAPGAAFVEGRFRRGDMSRGAGLGLAIMDAIAPAMGLRLERAIAAGVARVTLDFEPILSSADPRAPAPGRP